MSPEKPNEMGFLDHLEELRWRIVRGLIAIFIGACLSFAYIDDILLVLLSPSRNTDSTIILQSLHVQSMFIIKWFIAFVSGFIISLPFLIYQLWKFIAPGLKVNEKKFALPFVFFSSISFICGILFGYFILVPYSLEFFSGMADIHVENNFSIQYYFSFLTWILIGCGMIFQLPVVSLILSAIGLLTPGFMRHYRKHSFIVILILSSFITPPDPVSMLIMSLPLVLLYEISIGISWVFSRIKPN